MKSCQRLKTLSNISQQGFLMINKPEGISSFAVVKQVRLLTGVKKVGYAGTLDPFASGLLILALGKSYTTQIDRIHRYVKSYRAQMVLGLQTNTLDSRGQIDGVDDGYDLSVLAKTSDQFIGAIDQIPPIFSAKKIKGRRAYSLARLGQPVELASKCVTISQLSFSVIQTEPFPIVDMSVSCSTGTYIRALVRDIAKACHTVGYTRSLIRTAVGPFSVNDAITLDQLSPNLINASLIQTELD